MSAWQMGHGHGNGCRGSEAQPRRAGIERLWRGAPLSAWGENQPSLGAPHSRPARRFISEALPIAALTTSR